MTQGIFLYHWLRKLNAKQIEKIEAQAVELMHSLDMNSGYDIQTAYKSDAYYKLYFHCLKTKTPIKESWIKEVAIFFRIRKRSFQFTESLIAVKAVEISENEFIDFMWLHEKNKPKYFRVVKEFVTSHQEQVFQV